MKMKRKVLLPVLAIITLLACEDVLTSEEKGEKASDEFCECMKEKSLSECEDELNSKYSFYTNDEDFTKAFNNTNECDITISKKK
jgi:hypothetical protein